MPIFHLLFGSLSHVSGFGEISSFVMLLVQIIRCESTCLQCSMRTAISSLLTSVQQLAMRRTRSDISRATHPRIPRKSCRNRSPRRQRVKTSGAVHELTARARCIDTIVFSPADHSMCTSVTFPLNTIRTIRRVVSPGKSAFRCRFL